MAWHILNGFELWEDLVGSQGHLNGGLVNARTRGGSIDVSE